VSPVAWTAWKIRLLDAAEVADAWRIAPRIWVAFYLYMLHAVTVWYFALKDPTTVQSGFATAVWGFMLPVFMWYVQSGRIWTK
jgi:hypothetical protein